LGESVLSEVESAGRHMDRTSQIKNTIAPNISAKNSRRGKTCTAAVTARSWSMKKNAIRAYITGYSFDVIRRRRIITLGISASAPSIAHKTRGACG
jgi:hypothetical protein